jgi:hypothetical protein
MAKIYLHQNYLSNKLTKLDVKLLNLDYSYREYCDGDMLLYSELIESKKYSKLMKKINLLTIELELVQEIIKDWESMCEYKGLMGEQMLEYKNV